LKSLMVIVEADCDEGAAGALAVLNARSCALIAGERACLSREPRRLLNATASRAVPARTAWQPHSKTVPTRR
jgi:hypothetical protein